LINSTQKIDRLYAIGKMPAALVNTKLLIVITVIFLHSKAWPGKSGHVAMHMLHYAVNIRYTRKLLADKELLIECRSANNIELI